MSKTITWVSADTIAERQTKNIELQFATFRPGPRNSAMGFRGSEKKRRDSLTPEQREELAALREEWRRLGKIW